MRFTDFEEQAILVRSGLLGMGGPIGADDLRAVKAAYHGAGRFYHDWTHALSVLAWANHVAEYVLGQPALDLKLAALLHDVVYDEQGTPSNEQRSAEYASRLDGGDDSVEDMILATAQHGKLEATDVDKETALLLDCDLMSFTETRAEIVAWNDANIVKELLLKYSPEQVREGRRKFLAGMLAKRSVFLHPYFRSRYEAQARENIQRTIDAL